VDRAGMLAIQGLKSLQPARQLIPGVRRRKAISPRFYRGGVVMTRGTVFAVAAGFVIGLAFGCGSSKPAEASGGSDPTPVKPGDPAKPIAKDELPAAKAKLAELEVSLST